MVAMFYVTLRQNEEFLKMTSQTLSFLHKRQVMAIAHMTSYQHKICRHSNKFVFKWFCGNGEDESVGGAMVFNATFNDESVKLTDSAR